MALISNNDWVISIKSKLQAEVTPSSDIKTCIYRVPGWLKEHVCDGNDKTPYVPEIISFGPYYRGEEWLAEMEKHKWRCLKKMLQRKNQDVDIYLEKMKELEGSARACYQEPVKLDSNEFVEMLVLDGCFMLEFLGVHKHKLNNLEYTSDDPVFSKSTITHVIARDMIKLENQLPFMVLKRLLEIQEEKPISSDRYIARLVLRTLSSIWVTNQIPNKNKLKDMRKAVASDPKNQLLHCLDIFRSGLLYQPPSTSEIKEQVVDTTRTKNLSNSSRRRSQVSRSSVWDEEELHDPETGTIAPVLDVSSRIASSGSRPIQNRLNLLKIEGLLFKQLCDCASRYFCYLHSEAESDSSEINASNSRLDESEEQQLGLDGEVESSEISNVPDARPDEFEQQHINPSAESWSSENRISNSRQDEPEENLIHPNTDKQSSENHVSCSSSEDEEQNSERVMICGWRPQPYYEDIRNKSALMVCCVEDLRKAGVKFKSRECQSFWDLKFDKKIGLLEIPPIKIDDATKTVFLNLIAYEQCHLRDFTDMHITDYVAFMDKLVNSAADVGHLHQSGIMVHLLGSDVEVADLFNRLVKKAFVNWKDGKLKNLYEELNRYCTHKRHRWRASWHNEYMKNPWVISSIIAAILLFGATLLQTVFTVYPYYIPGKS